MKKILYALLSIATLVGCTKVDSDIDSPNHNELRLTTQISTRVNGTNWEGNESIGVMMYNAATTTAIGTPNTKYTTTSVGAVATFSSASPLIFPESDKVNITALYPYLQEAYEVDSERGEIYNLNMLENPVDLMSATANDVEASNTPVALSFQHQLSKIVVNMTAGNGLTTEDITDKVTVTLNDVATKGYYSFEKTEALTTTKETNDQPLTTSGTTASTFVIPQSFATNVKVSLTFAVEGYGEFEYMGVGEFEMGKIYTYNITIENDRVELSGCTIAKWGVDDNNNLGEGDSYVYEPDIILRDDIYEIYTAKGLRAFAALVNGTEMPDDLLAFSYEGEFTAFGQKNNFSQPICLTEINGELMSDIDLEGSETNQWTPIVGDNNRGLLYNGTFDGNGYTVSGLYINSGDDAQALFGRTNPDAVIRNLTVAGEVTSDDKYIGGIVGSNFGTISHCTNKATVTGSESAGGIVGKNNRNNNYSGKVINCINMGTITADVNCAGGAVGENSGRVVNCYNTSATTKSGVVGSNSGSVMNCYSSTANAPIGDNSGTVEFCYYDKDKYTSQVVEGCIGYTTDQMTNGTLLNSLNKGAQLLTSDGTYINWKAATGEYPTLGESTTVPPAFDINSKEDLELLSKVVNLGFNQSGVTFTLTTDIDLEGNDSNQWTPIGSSSTNFKGNFDGGNNTIRGLYININSQSVINNQSLFGGCSDNTIKNLTVEGSITVCEGISASGIAGSCDNTTIENCHNKASISGHKGVLAGVAISVKLISGCSNSGDITATSGSESSSIAGIVGGAEKAINCYNTGKIECSDAKGSKRYCGGIMGTEYHNIEIINCYNLGDLINPEPAEYSKSWSINGIIAHIDYNNNGDSAESSNIIQNCYSSAKENDKDKKYYYDTVNDVAKPITTIDQAFVNTLNATAASIPGAWSWALSGGYPQLIRK